MKSNIPYNALPQISPELPISKKVFLKCGDARAALAELKGAINAIPNPAVLINTIPLLETHSSNKIENIVTTQDKLFRFSAFDHLADPTTKEALKYRTALKQAMDKPITRSLMEEICSTIKSKPMGLRSFKVHIASESQAVYTPPDKKIIIQNLLQDWVRFINNPHFDPLIKMAILHYQFEAIHPFEDGNGRTGRILNLLFLVQQKTLDKPILYLSRYILENRLEYYRLLLEVTTKGAWNEWIFYMLDAVQQTSIWTLQHIQAVQGLMRDTKQYLNKKITSRHYVGMLMDVLFTYPYCRSSNLKNLGMKSSITSRKYLRQLVDIGILTEEKEGKELVFIHKKYLTLLLSADHKFTKYRY